MAAYEESDEYCPHCDNHYVGIYSLFLTIVTERFCTPGDRSEDSSTSGGSGSRGCSKGCSVRSQWYLALDYKPYVSYNRIIKDLRMQSARTEGDDIDDFLAECLG